MRSRALIAAVIAGLAVAAWLVLPHDLSGLRDAVAGFGPWAPMVLLGLWIGGTPLFVPGTVLCACAGLLLGPWGIALCLVGSPLGAAAAFGLARRAGPRVRLRCGIRRLDDAVARAEGCGVGGVAVLRMLPGMPVCAFNYACGLSRLRTGAFVVGSAVGAAPRVVLYGTLGSALERGGAALLIPAGAAVLVGGIALLAGRRTLAAT